MMMGAAMVRKRRRYENVVQASLPASFLMQLRKNRCGIDGLEARPPFYFQRS